MSDNLSENAMEIDAVLDKLEESIKEIKNPADRDMSSEAFRNPFFNYKKRYKSDLEILATIPERKKILDIGSSPYHLTYCLKKLGYDVIGVDINPDILKEFQKKHGLKVIQSDIQHDNLPFKKNEFDVISFCEVFEHLGVNPLKTIKELHRVLKPGGTLMLTTPNVYALHKVIRFLLGRSFNNPYEEFIKVENFGYMGHIREYSNREIKDILSRSGFSCRVTIYRKFDDFAKHPYLQFFPVRIGAYLLDEIMSILPFLKPFQVVLAVKE